MIRKSSDEKPDFDSTQTIIIKLVTSPRMWAVGSALIVAITWLVALQSDVRGLTKELAEFKAQTGETHKGIAAQTGEIHRGLEALREDSSLDVMASRLDALEGWRDHIEGVARSPPHPRKRK